jgi:hypothetical protein
MRLGPIKLALLAVGISCVVGCQQNNSLSGTVTYNGEPVQRGSVIFSSADGSSPGFGAKIVEGKYETEKVQLGQHVAIVRGLEEAPPMTREQQLESRKSGNRYGLPVDFIPEDAQGNAQTLDIQGGAQTIDFAITGPPRSDRPQAKNL